MNVSKKREEGNDASSNHRDCGPSIKRFRSIPASKSTHSCGCCCWKTSAMHRRTAAHQKTTATAVQHKYTAAHRKMTETSVQHNDLRLLRENLFRLRVKGRALPGQGLFWAEDLPRCVYGGNPWGRAAAQSIFALGVRNLVPLLSANAIFAGFNCLPGCLSALIFLFCRDRQLPPNAWEYFFFSGDIFSLSINITLIHLWHVFCIESKK